MPTAATTAITTFDQLSGYVVVSGCSSTITIITTPLVIMIIISHAALFSTMTE